MNLTKRSWIGIIIVIVGVGFLLEQANLIQFTSLLSDWWPLIFIIVGVLQISYHAHMAVFTGPLFIIVGVILLLHQWTDLQLFSYLWPLIIIYVGFIFIFFQAKHNKHIDEKDKLQSFLLFSGSEIKSQANPLKGGTITTIFGGAEIDLRDTTIEDDQITIEITSLFGGVSLRVPQHVRVEVSGVPIFGGWEDNTRYDEHLDHAPVILLKCVTIFGGAEISN